MAEFPDGTMLDTHRYEWMFGGKFLRNTHAVTTLDGAVLYEGEAVYGWDAQAEELRWWYFNSTGGHVTGNAVVDGDVVSALGVNRGAPGQTDEVKSELELGEGSWTSTSYFKRGEEWEKRFTMTFLPEE